MEEIDIHTILQISRFKKVELTGPPRIGTDATRKVLNLGKFGIAKVPSCRHGLPSLRRYRDLIRFSKGATLQSSRTCVIRFERAGHCAGHSSSM